MKLLFDQNLSPRLLRALADLYPDSAHVVALGLDRADDRSVWDYARQNGLAIVTKDADFSELSILLGAPPKVIWVRLGNCTTQEIADLLRRSHAAVMAFDGDQDTGLLSLV